MSPWTDPTTRSRRGALDATDIAFIVRKSASGYPPVAIAKMTGRSVDVVLSITRRPAVHAEPAPYQPPCDSTTGPRLMLQAVERVAQRQGVSFAEIMGRGGDAKVRSARGESYWEVRSLTKANGKPRFSLPTIGAFFDRDHTTIMTGVRMHEKRMAARAMLEAA